MKRLVQYIVQITMLALVLIFTPQASAATIHVPQDYSNIQSAINAAAAGDTILVSSGTYTGALTLNKGVTLQAETYDTANPRNNTTILDGNNAGAVITIPAGTSNNPKIVGFVLRNAGSGVLANSIFTIEYSHITDGDDLVEYEAGSGGINRGNIYTLAGDDCIDMDNQSNDVLIENNRCINPPDDSIEMRFQDDSLPNTITVTVRGNRFEGSGGDGFQFIDYNTDTKRRVILEKNLFLNNKKAGIGFLCCTKTSNDLSAHPMREEAQIINNTFVGNANGITGGGNALALNNIFLNTSGIALKNVTNSSYVSHNLFYGNGTNASGTTINNSILGNPQLDTNYIPQSGSPAIDAGIADYQWSSLFGTVNFSITEYNGNAPDTGWKETGFTGPTPTAGPSPTPLPTSTPALPTPTPNGGNLLSLIVAANSDDAEENLSNGTVSLTSTDLEFTTDGSNTQIVGMRFDSTAIPQGATITSAYIEFTANEAHSETTNLAFYAEATDNAATFTTATGNISSRQKTSVPVSWNNVPAWSIDNKYQTPDLSPIIQQVVNRPGWTSGNGLAILVTGTGHRTADSFNGNNADAPKLVVTYANPSSTPTVTPTPVPTYELSGVVYIDSNQNGVQDTGEEGYANTAVTVSTTPESNTNTDANGGYTFTNLAGETYTVALVVPSGYTATTANPATVAISSNTTQNFGITQSTTRTDMLLPTHDAYVDGTTSLVNTNFGTDVALKSDSSPVEIIYMKYNLSALSGRTITNAKLRTYVTNVSNGLQNIRNVEDTSWVETGAGSITYNNRPAVDSTAVTTFTPNNNGTGLNNYWHEVDLTNYVASKVQANAQALSIAIDSASSDGYIFNSEEAASNKVELVITSTGNTSATPTPTATPVPPTATPTPTSGTVTLTAIADTYVDSGAPTANNGALDKIQVDSSPAQIGYLKFDLGQLAGKTLTAVTLRVKTYTDSSAGSPGPHYFRIVNDTSWTESMNYNNRAAVSTVTLGSLPSTTFNTSYDVTLTPADIQSSVGGLFAIAVDPGHSDALRIFSKNAAVDSDRPQLIITYQ